VHLGQPWSKRGPLTPEMMLRWMDEHEIARAVVLPLISPEAWYYPISTDWVLQQTKPHRDRLIPFCDVDPRTTYLRGTRAVLDILKRYVDAGAKGLGEHKCGGPIDSPGNLDVFRAAGELRLPVLFHMDSLRNTDKPGLPGLEKILKEVPGSNFIGHAPGFWASISGDVTEKTLGGYPKGPVAPGGALDRLMEKHPNLYGEFSAGSGANSIRRDLEFGRQFIIRRADRLLFGTDYLAQGQKVGQFELFEGLDLPDDVRSKLYRQNALRILKLT
jgi:predicted TIM-barrel fold metal-dependent hydrolase